MGRRIDIMISSGSGVELALCEFKAKDRPLLLQQQQGKTLRVNKCILRKMQSLIPESKVMALTWGGKSVSLQLSSQWRLINV
jgi:hypothetical protein